LVIAAHDIPGHPAADPTRTYQPSASLLLTELSELTCFKEGIALIPTGRRATGFDEQFDLWDLDHEDHMDMVVLHVDQLRDALRRTQAPRHGRGPGEEVTPEDVGALLALDAHPALYALKDLSVIG
jgi:hypothetical protein